MVESVGELGNLIRKVRREQQLSQLDLAGAIGANARFIGELENGKETCQIGKVFDVIRGLGYEIQIVPRRKG